MESKTDNPDSYSSSGDAQADGNSARDTIESIWVAIIFAFVLRAFMVEAFVIPTGSMAPQLMGEHWHIRCPSCGYEYDYGASGQDADYGQGRSSAGPSGASCPNCGMYVPAEMARQADLRGGDRVLVLKYMYDFDQPRPWDVVVFKNPQNNRENYIKRLIGLPGETIQIVHGDVFYSETGPDGVWKIRRKSAAAQKVMWQTIFDNDLQPSAKIHGADSPPQWKADGGLAACSDGREFVFTGLKEGKLTLNAQRDAFLPHNAYNSSNQDISSDKDICGDLKLSCVFTPAGDGASVTMTLKNYSNTFIATIRENGSVELSGDVDVLGSRKHWTQLGNVGKFSPGVGKFIELVHVDLEASLWVDGTQVIKSRDDDYAGLDPMAVAMAMDSGQAPVPAITISASGDGKLSHLLLQRDVYYLSARVDGIESDSRGDVARSMGLSSRVSSGWGTTGNPISLARHLENPEYDEFFMLGDNSPCSLDSRSWTSAAPTLRLTGDDGKQLYHLGTVPRYNLLGRAFFVYWPAGFRIPILNLPILPDVGKMRLIR